MALTLFKILVCRSAVDLVEAFGLILKRLQDSASTFDVAHGRCFHQVFAEEHVVVNVRFHVRLFFRIKLIRVVLQSVFLGLRPRVLGVAHRWFFCFTPGHLSSLPDHLSLIYIEHYLCI